MVVKTDAAMAQIKQNRKTGDQEIFWAQLHWDYYCKEVYHFLQILEQVETIFMNSVIPFQHFKM